MLSSLRFRSLAIVLIVAIGFVTLFVFFAMDPSVAFAQTDIQTDLTSTGESAGFVEADLAVVVGRFIAIFLGLLGIILLVLLMYGGFLWMTAGGNVEQVAKAKRILAQAVVGLLIILASYAITQFIVQALSGQGIFGEPTDTDSEIVPIIPNSGSLGQGGIQTHYPPRNAQDVARNAKIMVTFQESMDVSGFLEREGDTDLNTGNVQIYPTLDGAGDALNPDEVVVSFTEDFRTFVFDPVDLLGTTTDDIQYTVALSDRLEDGEGDQVIDSGGYEWSFTVGTTIDLTAPVVRSVSPHNGGVFDRNISVQVNFNEAIDPTSASGRYADGDPQATFSNIQVIDSVGNIVDGEYVIGNNYQTVTFVSDEVCGTNSCDQTIRCLPADASGIDVIVHAATTTVDPPQADFFPYNGIVDVSANSLDGNGDGVAGDDYSWGFTTTNNINLDPPEIESIIPDILQENIDIDQDVEVIFDDVMLLNTISNETVTLEPNPFHEMHFYTTSTLLNDQGEEVLVVNDEASKTRVDVNHGIFLTSDEDVTYVYATEFSSQILNEYQNCFNPAAGPSPGGLCGNTPGAPYCCNGQPSQVACDFF